MRIMAVDFGDVRTGLAVSDRSGILCGEAWTIEERNFQRAADRIAKEAAARQVQRLVVGNPVNMNGTLGPRAEKSRELVDLLHSLTGLPVLLWDERQTTLSAQRILRETGRRGRRGKKVVDAIAAMIILEGYLASLKE